MNYQESIQLLEEMGLPESYMCPSCNEILIRRLRKIHQTKVFSCANCNFHFKIIICKLCKQEKYNHTFGICYACFLNSDSTILQKLKENEIFNKLIIISSRGKPDLAFSINTNLYNKITSFCNEKKMSRKEMLINSIKRYINSIH